MAGFLQAADVIESRPAFRLLLGAEPEAPLRAQADGRPLGVETRRGLEDLESQLADERNALPFSRQAADDVLRLARLLRRGSVEVRRYLKRFLHGKAYLFRGQGVIAGSANLHLRRSRPQLRTGDRPVPAQRGCRSRGVV